MLAACSVVPTPTPTPAARAPEAPPAAVREALAPTGRLRAAINFGNPILASRGAAGAAPSGVSVDIAQELARRLGVPVDLVTFDSAGQVSGSARAGRWDIAFLAVDPQRAADLAFTSPYVIIEGAYLVREDSPIRRNDEVDRDGIRIAVGAGSAYDLHLARELKRATLVRAASSPVVTDLFVAQRLDVAAGVRQQLVADARRLPGLRVLDGRFMVIEQAMATPRDRPAAAAWLQGFVEQMKSSGFVAAALARHRIEGVLVAPPAGAGR